MSIFLTTIVTLCMSVVSTKINKKAIFFSGKTKTQINVIQHIISSQYIYSKTFHQNIDASSSIHQKACFFCFCFYNLIQKAPPPPSSQGKSSTLAAHHPSEEACLNITEKTCCGQTNHKMHTKKVPKEMLI